MIALLAALCQAGTPTVGDTIWVDRSVVRPPGYVARLPKWELEGDVELLGTPILESTPDSIRIRYPLVVWRPGTHQVAVPGPVLIAPDGQVDSIPSRGTTIEVASVLPRVPPDSELPVRPEAGIVTRPVVSWWPLIVLLAVAAGLLAPLHWWWRRRGPRLESRAEPMAPVESPIASWADAGEHRAILAAATGTVREAVARAVPEAHSGLDTEACVGVLEAATLPWSADQVGRLLRELDQARFAPLTSDRTLALYQEASDLAQTIAQPEPIPEEDE